MHKLSKITQILTIYIYIHSFFPSLFLSLTLERTQECNMSKLGKDNFFNMYEMYLVIVLKLID